MEAEKTQKLHREDNSRFNSFKTMTSNSGTVMCVLSLLLSVGVLIRVETIDSRLETVDMGLINKVDMVCLSPVGYGYTAKHHIPQATNIPYQPC